MDVINFINEEIKRVEEEMQELQNRKRTLEARKQALLNLPETCPSCKGSGKERYTDAAGSADWRECMTCRGLGKVGPIECVKCGCTIGVDMVYVRRQPYPCCPWCGASLGGQYPIECVKCGCTIGVDMVYVRRQPYPCCPWCGASLGGQYSTAF